MDFVYALAEVREAEEEDYIKFLSGFADQDEIILWSVCGERYSPAQMIREVKNRTPLGREFFKLYDKKTLPLIQARTVRDRMEAVFSRVCTTLAEIFRPLA
jgi:hypothetical protein